VYCVDECATPLTARCASINLAKKAGASHRNKSTKMSHHEASRHRGIHPLGSI
jgi:hypothetical protein